MLHVLCGCVCSVVPQNVTAVTVHDINLKGTSSVALALSHVLLTPPLGLQLADLRSADLPIYGPSVVSAADVALLPYVGWVDLIGSLDPSNSNIQEAPGGFIIKGSVSAAHCLGLNLEWGWCHLAKGDIHRPVGWFSPPPQPPAPIKRVVHAGQRLSGHSMVRCVWWFCALSAEQLPDQATLVALLAVAACDVMHCRA